MKHILSIGDFSKSDLLHVMKSARKMENKRSDLLKGKIMAALFFESSTRTRLSFESSMLQLGGQVIGFADGEVSSAKKGESLADTIRVVNGYADIIVMRHPKEGSVAEAAKYSKVPVINAGDGTNEHPTQTLLDLYTIWKEKKKLSGLKIGFIGDLKNSRCVHSLSRALSHFKPEFYFVSHPKLKMPRKYLDEFKISCYQTGNLYEVSKELDILYVTRIQRERFKNSSEYKRIEARYKLGPELRKNIRSDARILSPLPRIDEMDPRIDDFPQSVYFKQAHNGIPVRKTLLAQLLGKMK